MDVWITALFATAVGLALCAALYYSSHKKEKERTELNVMAPLDIVKESGFTGDGKLSLWFKKLRGAGTDGIMVDIWWGLCEKSNGVFDFSPYKQLFQMCSKYGFKVLPIFSFHKCGGNVGDDVNIPLPKYVVDSGYFYKDNEGSVDEEYISLFYDDYKIEGMTPIQLYYRFMKKFKEEFSNEIQTGLISSISIGAGPCGEARYPSYRGRWSFPGIGSIQCFDDAALKAMEKDGIVAPIGATEYNIEPCDSEFWMQVTKNKEAIQFFDWYNQKLCDHVDKLLHEARLLFDDSVHLAIKVPGLHWWHAHASHGTEAASGLYVYEGSAYDRIATICQEYNAGFSFTCLEMRTNKTFGSDPEYLVKEVKDIAEKHNVMFGGENALQCYDEASFKEIERWSQKGLKHFTFLRLGDEMMKPQNWKAFSRLITKLHSTSYFSIC